LSFNNLTKIEGLESLTKLTDLSLFNNKIDRIEGLDSLANLNVLSLGNNSLKNLDSVSVRVESAKDCFLSKKASRQICLVQLASRSSRNLQVQFKLLSLTVSVAKIQTTTSCSASIASELLK
jgi:Leucine-rich repeat (LRR) protein